MNKASGIIRLPFISTFFWFKYVIFAYIGSACLNIFYFDYELSENIYERKDLLLQMWYFTTAGLFLLPFGMFIANGAFKYNALKTTKLFLSKYIFISKLDRSGLTFFYLWIIFIIGLITLYIYSTKIPEIPIMAVFEGLSISDLNYLRSESGNNFHGRYYIYETLMKTVPLLLLFIVFFLKNLSKKWKIFFYILLFYNMFVAVMDISKAPIIKLMLLLGLAYFHFYNRVNLKVLFLSMIISVITILIMYIFFMGMIDKNFFELLFAPLHRIFIGQIVPFYHYLLFQEEKGFIYLASLPNPAGIFPFETRRITVEVMNFAQPWHIKAGLVGSMPTVFFVEWFISFGTLMALFSMILWGFILQAVDIYFITKLAKKKTLFLLVLFIYMINYFGGYAGTGYMGIIIDTKLVIPIIVIISIIVMRNILLELMRKISEKNSINSIK
jgi:hypothetical protein